MQIQELQSKSIGILGFGQEGQAIAEYLGGLGILAVVYDKKPIELWSDTALAKLHHLQLNHYTKADYIGRAISENEVIFRSPGIKIPESEQKSYLDKGVIITSQAKWFFEHCPAKIIGVTGTKGKGTTCSLLAEILTTHWEKINPKVKIYLTGNIGKIQPLSFLSDLTPNDIVVYELSSFQLQDLAVSPYIGITLMVTEDHLDYHDDLKEYWEAKTAISKYQTPSDFQIYNFDYEASKLIGEQGLGQKFLISSQTKPNQGAYVEEDKITLIGQAGKEEVIDTTKRLLRGKHNLENIAAASLGGKLMGVPLEIISESVQNFKGLKHRLQYVAEVNGIKFFNDSISTIPDTTIAALKSFTEPTVLMLGGADKNLNYEELVKFVINNTKGVVTIGQTGKVLGAILKEKGYKGLLSGPFSDFKLAFESATSMASPGDVVVLSPAATSFDMFNNYAERGDIFISLVNNL